MTTSQLRNAIKPETYALGLIVAVGFSLRFYNIEIVPLRWDELVVPLAAQHSLEYIIEWCRRCEVHPPLFHFVEKLILLGGQGEVLLRLPAFSAGVFMIPLTFFFVRRFFSLSAALVAAALIATDPFLILFSRMVRPYTIWLCLLLLSFWCFLGFVGEYKRGAYFKLLVVNTASYLLHFLSVIVFPAQVIAVFIAERSLASKRLWLSLLSVAVPFAVVLPFLLGMAKREPIHSAHSFSSTAEVVVSSIARAFFPFYGHGFVQFVLAAGMLLGLAKIFKIQRNLFYLISCTLLFPIVVIVLFRYGSYNAPWHMIFMPFCAIICLSAVCNGLREKISFAVAAAAAAANVFFVFSGDSAKMYRNDYVYEGSFSNVLAGPRDLASYVSMYALGGHWIVMRENTSYYPVVWYVKQLLPFVRIEDTFLDKSRESVSVVSVSTNLSACDGSAFEEKGPYGFCFSTVSRALPRSFDKDKKIVQTAEKNDFFSNAHEARNITLFSERGWSVHPSKNGDSSVFSFSFVNDKLEGPVAFVIDSKLINGLRGGVIQVEATFDDEPPVLLSSISGEERAPKEDFLLLEPEWYLVREKEFKVLTLTYSFSAPLTTPGYPGGNLSLMAFLEMSITPKSYGLDFFNVNDLGKDVAMSGLSGVEQDDGRRWRWASGSQTEIKFNSQSSKKMMLEFALTNVCPDQHIIVLVNGKQLDSMGPISPGKWLEPSLERSCSFDARKGENSIIFHYGSWNMERKCVNDPSPYSAAFTKLRLRSMGADSASTGP